MNSQATQSNPPVAAAAVATAPVAAHSSTAGIDRKLLDKARARLEALYAAVAKTWPGFIARPGQHQMMHAALLTFLSAKEVDDENRDGSNLAQLEAGTGTGKTVAYCLAAIVAAEFLKKTVIVSTATVALQEQLFHKDLPRLAKIIPELKFDILKGRGRYLCESRLAGAISGDAQESLLDDDFRNSDANPRRTGFGTGQGADRKTVRDPAHALVWFNSVAKKLHGGRWDGDIDNLDQPPQPEDWQLVQASAQACNASQCEFFKSCAFFKARRQAATATLQIANHALVLATLQTDSTVIDAANTLFVFDEAHQLPGIAADQFSYRARMLSSVNLLTGLRSLVTRNSRNMPASTRPDVVAFGLTLTECTDSLTTLAAHVSVAQWVSSDKPLHRFAQGVIAETLIPECERLVATTQSILSVVESVAAALMQTDESKSPEDREEQVRAGVEMGVVLSRLDTLNKLFSAWATNDAVPWAKWIEYVELTGGAAEYASATHPTSADAWLCASPLTAAQILAKGLWKTVSAAVCTSATLTACGSFEFFDRMSGMNRYAERRALIVDSPFNYATQGELRIAPMKYSPKSPEFSDELCRTLPDLLRAHAHGQLVLFTSRRQMLACHGSLPKDLLKQVQMQGESSRTELLKEHGRRVMAGQRSIIFGLQSFGEGIDLPGKLCEHVVIDKLPFSPPDSPVDAALSEWLINQGRDPFTEISVPRASMKLAQWAGRGVRTVSDWAVITVCDTRLVTTRYGKNILEGLPPFPVVRGVA